MRIMETEAKEGLERITWYGFSNLSVIECVQHVRFIEYMLANDDVYSDAEGTVSICYQTAVHNFLSLTEEN